MPKPRKLTMGAASPAVNPLVTKRRIEEMHATVSHYLPSFVTAVKDAADDDSSDEPPTIMLHHDTFAAGYDDDECTLFGMALRYAGLDGVMIQVIFYQCEIDPRCRKVCHPPSCLRWSKLLILS